MTQIQFSALAARLSTGRVLRDVAQLPHFSELSRGAQCTPRLVRQWLLNGWSTENLLRFNLSHLEGEALSHSLHWAFPQAYYSVYALTMAYFQAVGFTEQSHTAVIRKFGSEAVASRYPATVSFALLGGKQRSYHHIAHVPLPNTLQFDPSSPEQCDARICQFLNATRDLDLSAKKVDFKFKTVRGTPKKSLKSHEWDRVATSVGPTSILSLLYRKRIKANYRDIDTYLSPGLDAATVYRSIVQTVLTCNFVHELFVMRAIGKQAFRELLPLGLEDRFAFLAPRLSECESRAA